MSSFYLPVEIMKNSEDIPQYATGFHFRRKQRPKRLC
jgi:hypothetical protein